MKPYPLAAAALLAALFAINVYRAFTQAVVHDEALTWELLLTQPWPVLFQAYDANHHVLNTIFEKITTGILGLSAFSLRLPSLAGGALYFWAAFRLSLLLFGEGWLMLLSVAALSLNPYLLDFLSAARGYGMAIAFLFVALLGIARWLATPGGGRRAQLLWGAGVALALSVTANLTLAFPAVALCVALLAAMILFKEPAPPVDRKVKRAKQAEPPPGAAFVFLNLLLPFGIAGFVLLIGPLSAAGRDQFYAGVTTLAAAVDGLVRGSFVYRSNAIPTPEWTPVKAGALAVVLVAIAAGVWLGRARRLPFLFTIATTLALALAFVLGTHLLLNLPLPGDRTGLYWIPLVTLLGLMLVPLAGRLRIAAAVPLAAAVVVYVASFNVSTYREWRYDASTRDLVGRIRDRHAATPAEPVVIGASWQLEPTINFYRVVWNLSWLREVERGAPRPGSTYYLLMPQDAALLSGMNLKVVETAPSGVVLATGPE